MAIIKGRKNKDCHTKMTYSSFKILIKPKLIIIDTLVYKFIWMNVYVSNIYTLYAAGSTVM